jgi:NADH-quinone oxidoreductase subunit N
LVSLSSVEFFAYAIAAILFSVVSAFYYLRLVKIMYFDEAKNVITLDEMPNAKATILFTAIVNLLMIFFLNHILTTISSFL